MISQQLLEELKGIFKAEYRLDLNDQEIREIADQLLRNYEILITLFKENHFEDGNDE